MILFKLMMEKFKLKANFSPKGDQPEAIEKLTKQILDNQQYQILLGVTGSGKTFTIANLIKNVNRPTLVISPNKTLAAQLYTEFQQFFSENAVEYFVSYYDYYQPEAYIPQTDTYIEKDASINDALDRLRLKATTSLLERNDVIIVASVSCIYNIGSPQDFSNFVIPLQQGFKKKREMILRELTNIRYERNDFDFKRGTFRVRGNIIDIYPSYLETGIRIEFWEDEIISISEIDPLTGKKIRSKNKVFIYPATHFVTAPAKIEDALKEIEKDLEIRLKELKQQNKLLEAQRLEMRTKYDLEMIRETGYCHGIENYSRYFSGRKPGERPYCLIDYFPKNFLTVIDESHITIGQLSGMYEGDYARKKTLIEYGFRLPSALDNRPLKFAEFENLINQVIFVSATPGTYEMSKVAPQRKAKKQIYPNIVEQIVRPTGLVDPQVRIKPTKNQIDDLIKEINKKVAKKQRILVTTLTKRMAEDLAAYLTNKGLKVRYLHSEIDTLKRVEILRDLRKGEFDCLIGVNLLREGLDLPEVSLVAILDADKEGFLRSETSLIQLSGRAARNVDGEIIMYADKITGSMKNALQEMERRRKKQIEYNLIHHITPKSIEKTIVEDNAIFYEIKEKAYQMIRDSGYLINPQKKREHLIEEINRQMKEAADRLDFELATILRDKLLELKNNKNEQKKNKFTYSKRT